MTDEILKICQWNCRSAIANKDNLEHLLYTHKIKVALLSETWFKPGVYVNFSEYNTVRKDRADGKGGVAILIKNNIKYNEINLPHIDNCMHVCITINVNNNIKLSLVSLYVRPQSRINLYDWNLFFNAIPKPFVVGGDFNAHHMAWGCDHNDVYGNVLMNSLDYNNLIYLNDGSPTYVGYQRQSSAIDLTICSPQFQHNLEWYTILDPHGSDHVPIVINCQCSPEVIQRSNYRRWNIKKANWDTYYLECNNNIRNTDINNYHKFTSFINQSAKSSIPEFKNMKQNVKNTGKFWWNDQCEEAVKNRKVSFQKYKSNPNLHNLLEYKKMDALSKKIIKETKRESWRSYCSSLNKNIPIRKVWQKLNAFKNRKQKNQIPVDSSAEWLEKFHCKLAPPFVNSQPLELSQENQRIYNNNNNYLLKPFSMQELNRALKQNNNTAPGKDNVHYSMLSNIPNEGKRLLLNIFNNIFLNKAQIPEDWYDYIIIPLLKPNKPEGNHNSYRPIALASCVMKTYERLIKNRLEFWLESNNIIPSSQFGFRKSTSTQENIASLLTEIQLGFTTNKSSSVVFLDITGAYDNVNLKILANKMQHIGIPDMVILNVYNLYCLRNIYIRTNNNLIGPRQTSVGLPQGSILSPILYIIYSHDFEQQFLNNNIKIYQYADDYALCTQDKDIEVCHSNLQLAVEKAAEWFEKNGSTIAEEKSSVCTFTRSRFQPPRSIKLSNFEISYRTSVKYLGMILDKKLNWKEHINYITKKSENALNIIRAFCSHNWGADPNICLLFYRSLIRSIIDYGSVFYGSATENHLKKIEVIKNKSLRLSIGFLKSTPINILETECCEPPLNIRRQLLSDRTLSKLYSKSSETVNKIHDLTILCYTARYWHLKKLPLLVDSYSWISDFKEDVHSSKILPYFTADYEAFETLPEIKFLDLHENAHVTNTLFKMELNNNWRNYEHIFTDGSRIDNRTGCAFYHHNIKYFEKYKLLEGTSVYTAELTAIREAMKYCLHYKSSTNFVIFTDCKSALKKIEHLSTKNLNYIIIDIINLHKKIIAGNKRIQIVWLKGHSGITQNEYVDNLAKQATEDGAVIPNFKIPYSDLNQSIKKK